MPRPLRSFEPGGTYHLTSRGNNDAPIVRDDTDRRRFVSLLAETSRRYLLDVQVWCLMTNHYHLVVRARTGVVSPAIQFLNSAHSRAHNVRRGWSGHVFVSRFRATTVVDEKHFANTREYVLDNPIRAGLVDRREEWPWLGCSVGAPS